MNIDEMPAGNELDRLVAEKVMKWRRERNWKRRGWWSAKDPLRAERGNGPHNYLVHHSEDWHPSADIVAAWEVIEKMIENKKWEHFSLVRWYDRGQFWWVSGATDDDEPTHSVDSETPMLAICRAALKAVGK